MVTAPTNPLSPAVITLIRYALTALGSVMVSKGIINEGELDTLIGALLIVIPTVVGVVQSFRNAKAIKAAAPRVPDSIIAEP